MPESRSKIQNPKSKIPSRRAFTLVEMLIVIVIIGILIALVLPALASARIKANEGRVVAEIRQLEAAITAFKARYGVEPPSRLVIHLTEAGWTGDPATRAQIRRIWPQFDFRMNTGSPPGGNSYPTAWDTIASNQGHAEYIGMNSGECLLFFLGGVNENSAPTGTLPIGFAKNPAFPFAPRASVQNREPLLLEFDAGRIRDTDNNGVAEFLDSLPGQSAPYAYFSSYEGKSYRVTGTNPPPEVPVGTLVDVYRVSSTLVSPPGTATFSLSPHKAQSFQIISPGYDANYGLGGVFNPDLGNAGLANSGDYDNLTNFHGGRLKP